jgi:hypothetical protein
MRIISLTAENFQKLKVLSIEPKSNVIKISGANASGKSSALDAIGLALLGARGGPSVPVRKGADRAVVRLDLGEFWVTRQWAEGADPKGEMWIEAKDGKRYGTPQKVLDAAMGKISFDPLAFTRMETAQQSNELRQLLDLDEPLAALKAKYDEDYETRKNESRELKTLEAQRKGIEFPADLPAKKRNIDAMVEDLGKVAEYNTGIERERMDRERVEHSEKQIADKIAERLVRLDALRLQIEQIEADTVRDKESLDTLQRERVSWKPLPKPKDASALSDEITTARAVNAAIEQRERAERMDKEIATRTDVVAKLNRAIDDNRQAAVDLIAKADYPVPGLGFAEGEVTFNGLPFRQASNAEQIKVSIAIAMIGNPKLRVMRIKDGSLLDDDSMAVVEEMAEKNDYQVFIEVVDTTGEVGVYLVDGEIAAIDGQPVGDKPKPTLKPARKKATKATKQSELEL